MNKIMLGFIMPKTEEKFKKLWNTLGRCLWMFYTGQTVSFPVDYRKESKHFTLQAKIEIVK